MKRNCSRPNPRVTVPARPSSERAFHGAKKSGSRLCDSTAKPAAVDAAKTSEYAFFQKLKKDVGVLVDSQSCPRMESQSKRVKSSDCLRERTSIIKNSLEDFKSLLLVESASPGEIDSMDSPLVNIEIKGACTTLKRRHSNQRNFLENGVVGTYLGIFYRKRQKLHHYVAEISISVNGELFSDVHDIVSLLLSRLVPQSNGNSVLRNSMQRQMDTNMEPKTISFLQPDNYFTKVQPPAESFMELDYGPCTDDDLSSFWPSRPGREIFSNYDLFCNSNDKNHQTRQPWGFNCESEGRTTLWDEINSTVEVPMEEYRIVTPDNFEEPDEVCDRGESLLVTMPGNLLLGWELQHSVEERNSSITYKSPLNASITLSNSSFFSPNYGSQVSPLPCSSLPSSPSSPNNDFERRYIKEKEDIAARWKHIPLTLPHDTTSQVGSIFRFPESDQWCMSKMFREYHPSLTDAFNSSEMVFNFGSEYLTGQRCITTYHGPQFEQVAARIKKESRTFLDGAKYGGISSEIENVALQDWSSFYFQIFHNQEKASWPLVRDNPVWEEVAEEIH